MKLGVLSDTHNNLTNLERALAFFRREGVHTVIHCGDLTSPETASALSGFRVIHSAGNNDYANGAIREVLLGLDPTNFSGLIFSGEVDGVQLAVVHGHMARSARDLASSGRFQYVFTGHSHRRKDEWVGDTRLVNPGALGGLKAEERSIFLLDTSSGVGRFYELSQLKD
jgi:putative phosphoesterase